MQALSLRQGQSLSPAHKWFTNHLPELTSRTHALFSRLRYEERQDAVAEVLAFIFQYALRADQRGVLGRLTPYSIVVFFGRNFRSGRRFAGSSSLCPLSKQTQILRGVSVHSMEEAREEWDHPSHRHLAYRLAETLPDRHTHDRPFENVRCQVDYPDIRDREGISPKARRVFDYLLETNSDGQLVDLGQELRVTPGRISQFRVELADALAGHGYTPGAGPGLRTGYPQAAGPQARLSPDWLHPAQCSA